MAGSRVRAFHILQVRNDEYLKDSGTHTGPPMTTVIGVKRNHGPKETAPHEPGPCYAHLNGLRATPTFSHGIFHPFLKHESTCHKHVCL